MDEAIPNPVARESHPVWVRGLKQTTVYTNMLCDEVAPRVGAWIETLGS